LALQKPVQGAAREYIHSKGNFHLKRHFAPFDSCGLRRACESVLHS
jgi:hypothetical protein